MFSDSELISMMIIIAMDVVKEERTLCHTYTLLHTFDNNYGESGQWEGVYSLSSYFCFSMEPSSCMPFPVIIPSSASTIGA